MAGGAVTADGCPVEVYRRLPALGEPELVSALAGPGTRILELGAGCGRIADPLAASGHDVVAVDDSPAMLASVRRARPVLAGIGALDLGERFEAVLLASHLVNVPEDDVRHGFLTTAARHLRPAGRLIVQWHPPEWFDRLPRGRSAEGTIGPFTTWLTVHSMDGGLLTATVTYGAAGSEWTQQFRARRLSPEQVARQLADVGLRLENPVEGHPDWLTASRPPG